MSSDLLPEAWKHPSLLSNDLISVSSQIGHSQYAEKISNVRVAGNSEIFGLFPLQMKI